MFDFETNGFPLVQFNRRPIDRHLLLGFALAWTDDLTLVQVIDDSVFQFNGYAVLRNSDVRRWRAVAKEDFFARAARLNRLRPSMPRRCTRPSQGSRWARCARPSNPPGKRSP